MDRLVRTVVVAALAVLALGAARAPAHAQLHRGDAPVVGIALSGGSAKGFAHVGVLRVLEEMGIRVDVVAGTSMGSVVGGLYATGMSVDSLESLFRSIDWPIVLGDGAERERRFLHQRRFDERAVATLPIQGGIVGLPAGAVSGSNIIRLAEVTTWRAATTRDFTTLPKPFVAVATDIVTGEAVTMRSGVLSEALRASTGIPGAFDPFEIDGRLLVDGAVARNLPAQEVRDLGADIVICSDVSDPLARQEELGTLMEVLDQVMTLTLRQSLREQRALCDVLIQPDVGELSGLDFEAVDEWIARGVQGAREAHEELEVVWLRQGTEPPERVAAHGVARRLFRPLGDSVRIVSVEVAGSPRPETERLVRGELGPLRGVYVTSEGLASRLSDIDATGLFGMVHYRLDEAQGGARLTVRVQERPKNRLGIGLRYDDHRRAALLFTTTLHNLLRYGSVTRFDLRVGEETRARVTYLRRHGVTGRFELGTSLGWSQSPVPLPGSAGLVSQFEITHVTSYLGLVGGRTTFGGLEANAEWAVSDQPVVEDVLLLSGAAVLDHESLDRIDFPRSGTDATVRWEWGGTDLVGGEGFSLLTANARTYLPLSDRLTADLGAFVGVGRGLDLPTHRNFFLGGAHPSAVFPNTHPTFHGVGEQVLWGTAAQIARAGVRLRLRSNIHVRAGVDVGGAMDQWRFPIEDPVVGWAVSLGASTIIGPVQLEWSKADQGAGSRLAVSVGRRF